MFMHTDARLYYVEIATTYTRQGSLAGIYLPSAWTHLQANEVIQQGLELTALFL